MNDALVINAQESVSGEIHLVPETLPPTQPLPEPARRIAFFQGVFLHWVLPHRLGPHLAVGPFRPAIIAMTLSVWFAAAIIVYCMFSHFRADGFRLSDIRQTFAYAILVFAAKSAHSPQHWIPVLLVVLGPVPVGVLAGLCGMLVSPWCMDGDAGFSGVCRSVKNALWATTVLIPGAVVWAAVYLSNAGHYHVPEWDPFVSGVWNLSPPTTPFGEDIEFMVYGLVPIIVFTHYLICVFFGAMRYVGLPLGPGFESRTPQCERCGYRIVDLSVKGNCPECGRSISASLSIRPSPRRPGESAFWIWRHTLLPLRITLRFLADRDSLCRIATRADCSSGRLFSALTSIAMMALIVAVAYVCTWDWDNPRDQLTWVAILSFIPVVAKVGMMTTAVWWARFRLGISDGRIPLNICCYASCLLWPAVLAVSGVAVAVARFDLRDALLIQHWELNVAAFVVGAGGLVLILGSLAGWSVRVVRALNAARFANS